MANLSKLKKLIQSSGKADDVLQEVNTVEKALALKGAEREAYEQALTQKYGDKAKRAFDTQAIDLDELQAAHDKAKRIQAEYGIDSQHLPTTVVKNGEIVDLGVRGPTVQAYNPSNPSEVIGSSPFKFDKLKKTLKVDDKLTHSKVHPETGELLYPGTEVDEQFSRKGIASALYNKAEQETGIPVTPSTSQSFEGKQLWRERNPNTFDSQIREYRKYLEDPNLDAESKEAYQELIESTLKQKEGYGYEYRPFGNPRHPDAAFDPRFKDSPYVKALTGSSPRPVDFGGSVLKSLGDVYSKTLGKAEDVASDAKKALARKLVEQTQLAPADIRGQDWYKEQQSDLSEIAESAADMALPGPTDAVTGGMGKFSKLGMLGKKATNRAADAVEALNKSPKSEFGRIAVIPSAADVAKQKADALYQEKMQKLKDLVNKAKSEKLP